MCSFWSETSRKANNLFSQFLVTPEGLLGAQAQIKDDLTGMPENIGSDPSKLQYVLIRV